MKALDGLGLAAVAVLTATGIAWMSPGSVTARGIALEYSLRPDTDEYGFQPATLEALEGKLLEKFGEHASPHLPEDLGDYDAFGMGGEEELARGRELYRTKCLHCHGVSGGGDGPTAKFLIPRPRNFRDGKVKFTSTLRAAKPTREDLRRTLRDGVAYTAMPSFQVEEDEDIEALISYVQFLMLRGEVERLVALQIDDEGDFEDFEAGDMDAAEFSELLDEYFEEQYEYIQDQWGSAEDEQVFPEGPRPPATPESIARGRRLFMSETAGCVNCHNGNGDGKGPNVYGEILDPDTGEVLRIGYKLKDEWGNEARPADLRKGFYRGGNRPLDLYRRVHQGIKGTPMPAIADMHANDEDIWALVNFVLSLPYNQ